MSADTPIKDQILEHRKTWQELWWNMAAGDIASYREIKKLDVFEFWPFFDKWREKTKKDLENKQNQQRIKK